MTNQNPCPVASQSSIKLNEEELTRSYVVVLTFGALFKIVLFSFKVNDQFPQLGGFPFKGFDTWNPQGSVIKPSKSKGSGHNPIPSPSISKGLIRKEREIFFSSSNCSLDFSRSLRADSTLENYSNIQHLEIRDLWFSLLGQSSWLLWTYFVHSSWWGRSFGGFLNNFEVGTDSGLVLQLKTKMWTINQLFDWIVQTIW